MVFAPIIIRTHNFCWFVDNRPFSGITYSPFGGKGILPTRNGHPRCLFLTHTVVRTRKKLVYLCRVMHLGFIIVRFSATTLEPTHYRIYKKFGNLQWALAYFVHDVTYNPHYLVLTTSTIWNHLHKSVKSCDVDVLNSVTYLELTPIFEWHVIRCGSNNKHQNRMDYMSKNMSTIWSSKVNIIGGEYNEHSLSTRIFTLVMNMIFIQAPKIMRKVVVRRFQLANHLVLHHMFHIVGETG